MARTGDGYSDYATPAAQDKLKYMADSLLQFRLMASSEGEVFLDYLIGMAAEEARRRAICLAGAQRVQAQRMPETSAAEMARRYMAGEI